jgi:AraC-like DNA-binding protein
MFDEIYVRLLADVMPESIKPNTLDFDRLLTQFHAGTLPTSVYGLLIHQAYSHNPESDIGLRFGQHLHPATLCDLSRALLTSSNTRQLLKLIAKYHFTHGASYFPSIHIADDCWSIALTYPFENKAHRNKRRFCAEAAFYYFMNSFNELLSQPMKPKAVYLDFPKPVYADEYSAWGCPVYFDHTIAMISFQSDFLEQPFHTSSPILHKIYINKCIDRWRKSASTQHVEHRAVCLMMQDHPDNFHSEALASKLNISVRGLQKRFNKQGESFSKLTHYARRELSKIYLFQKQETLDATAEKLGFQSASGFRRFFKQEFKQTPVEYLNHLP